jgi:hypothetical protein
MPQPLSRVKRDAEIEIGPGGLLAHPNFAVMVTQVISAWSYIDGTFAALVAQLLKADIAAGAAMYQALNGSEAKRAVLLAAVDANHPEWQQLLLRAVLKAIKPSRDQRNDFAHNIWASSKQLPDAVLLIAPEAHIARHVKLRQVDDIFMSGREVPEKDKKPDYDRSKIQVYREADFKKAVSGASHASLFVNLLWRSIGEHRIEQVRRELVNEPLIQQALQQLIRGKSPLVQLQLSPPGDDPPAPGISEIWDRALGRIP